ncbi:Zinc finger protein 512 [Apodemus speciosus]|uniref:Zinc finger protein 512 n=1 Tax=Apodemus speciosus TaxID=105296 RepID=A0ABQ0FA56_APOSI
MKTTVSFRKRSTRCTRRLKLFVSEECSRFQCPILSTVGSMEEKWYLVIMEKSSVSSPTCQAVRRKTIECLQKRVGNCKQAPLKRLFASLISITWPLLFLDYEGSYIQLLVHVWWCLPAERTGLQLLVCIRCLLRD